MTPPWGINWQCYHKDQQDMPHVEKMGYRSFTTYEWMWSDRGFCNELLAVARGDAIFLNRDHPKSEEKDDLWESDPAQKGRNHADDWAQKVREGHVFTPLDRTYFLGLNEPNSNEFQRQIDAYNEAYCRRMAEHGLRAAAYSFGVGHPSTVGLRQDTPPDWHWYAASAAAVLEGHHLAAFHEYGAPDDYGWDFWCNRSRFCPYAFDVVLDECGIDHGVVDGQLYGWAKYLTPEQYMAWLDGFQVGMAERAPTRTVKLLAYNIFSFDHGRGETKDWHSFDIRPLRPLLETHQWSQPKIAAAPPVQTHLPTVSTGPKPVSKPILAFVIAPAGAYVRNAPVTGDVLTAIPYGDQLRIVGVDNPTGWFRVQAGEQEGWMAPQLVSVHAPEPQPQPVGDAWPRSIEWVLRWEGGYQNNPADIGNWTGCAVGVGENKGTKYGISACSYPALDIRNLTIPEARDIYFRDYWQASGADKLQWPLCLAHFDTAVNAGIGRANEMLEKSGGDFLAYMGHLIGWYTRINGFETFGRAWIKRRAEILLEASK